MPPFRDRPVTYLFLGATAAVIPALAAPEWTYLDVVWVQGLIIGQIMLSGAWLALGSTHRLARGAVCIAATAGLAAFAMSMQGRLTLHSWHRALARVFMIQLVVAVAVGLALQALQRLKPGTDDTTTAALRFPVVEIFGWTIVVALASLLLRDAEFLHLFLQWRSVVWMFGCSVAGTAAAALHRPKIGKLEIALVSIAALAFLSGCFLAPTGPDLVDLQTLAVAIVFVIAYCLCRRVDESLKQRARDAEESKEDD
ncbi:hypothetical protein OAS39_05435 [Pirellulales bacterium]|nr:hypothetical protein [Pirellulales bacterium]